MAEVDSVDVITDRLIEIVDEIVTTASDVFPNPLTTAHLPFAGVTESTAAYFYPSAHTIAINREWIVTIWVQEYPQSDQPAEQTARRAARPYITRLARLIGNRRQLQNAAGAALNMVIHAEVTADFGADSAQRDGKFYAGLSARVNVTYREDLYD